MIPRSRIAKQLHAQNEAIAAVGEAGLVGRDANCFSVRNTSSRASAGEGTGVERVNLSAISKISFVWN